MTELEIFRLILLTFLVVCAAASAVSRSMLVTVIIFMTYGLVMSILWVVLRAPDLAVTEAAVGVCITSSLFFVTLRRLNLIRKRGEEDADSEEGK